MSLLSRFDALFLFPTLGLMLLAKKEWRIVFRPNFFAAIFLCFVLAAPAYWISWNYFGDAQVQAATSGTSSESTHFMALGNFLFYPLMLRSQMGLMLLLSAIFGLILLLRPELRKAIYPYFALILATYITFSPMAELESRHAIYWIPAFTSFAAIGIAYLIKSRWKLLGYALALASMGGNIYADMKHEPGYVLGYEAAAQYVLDHTKNSRYCLFDNYLNGNFIFQIRKLDSGRKLGVLRGDKLFYGVFSDPHAAYKEFAVSKEDILAGIFTYDPEYIVVESPQINFVLPMATLLRQVLQESTDRFELVKTIPIRSNRSAYQGASLLIYRNLLRNPHPQILRELQMVGMGTSIKAND
jgi:hypothetical protein